MSESWHPFIGGERHCRYLAGDGICYLKICEESCRIDREAALNAPFQRKLIDTRRQNSETKPHG